MKQKLYCSFSSYKHLNSNFIQREISWFTINKLEFSYDPSDELNSVHSSPGASLNDLVDFMESREDRNSSVPKAPSKSAFQVLFPSFLKVIGAVSKPLVSYKSLMILNFYRMKCFINIKIYFIFCRVRIPLSLTNIMRCLCLVKWFLLLRI
jgi:hypothetical protein